MRPEPWQSSISRRVFLQHVKDQLALERQLAKILRDASVAAARIVNNLSSVDGIGEAVRRAQFARSSAVLRQLEQELWRNIGNTTTTNMEKAAALSVTGAQLIDEALAATLGNSALADSFTTAAQRAALNVMSRTVNNINLSTLVYNNRALMSGKVDTIINRGLALNKSAREMARDVRMYINPDVPGGVNYSAMRLGRTEINNAFHETTRSIAAQQPWVMGIQWEISGSHPYEDECDDYADSDGYDLGAGVYPAADVPDKPHPQCLCYTTVITVPPSDFVDSLVAGEYDDFLGD